MADVNYNVNFFPEMFSVELEKNGTMEDEFTYQQIGSMNVLILYFTDLRKFF
jgi:hypothetical protein